MNNHSLISLDLHKRTVARVNELFDLAETHTSVKFNRPSIVYKNRGSVAGTARYGKNELSLNPKLFIENVEAFFEDTIPHEVAHFVATQLWNSRGHDFLWQKTCEMIGAKTNKFHKFDIESVKIKQTRWVYYCDCRVRNYTTVRHNKILRGKVSYSCKTCGKQTYPVLENGQFKRA